MRQAPETWHPAYTVEKAVGLVSPHLEPLNCRFLGWSPWLFLESPTFCLFLSKPLPFLQKLSSHSTVIMKVIKYLVNAINARYMRARGRNTRMTSLKVSMGEEMRPRQAL